MNRVIVFCGLAALVRAFPRRFWLVFASSARFPPTGRFSTRWGFLSALVFYPFLPSPPRLSIFDRTAPHPPPTSFLRRRPPFSRTFAALALASYLLCSRSVVETPLKVPQFPSPTPRTKVARETPPPLDLTASCVLTLSSASFFSSLFSLY